jgi:hypothetical protein
MKYLYARDIAERRGITERAARGWLLRLEREHGARVVGRAGSRRFTTDDALATVAPGFDRTRARFAAIEERVRRLAKMVRGMVGAIEGLDATLRQLGGPAHNAKGVEIDRAPSACDSDRFPQREGGVTSA